ncbi:GNAT family N-acetyltransferase [Sporosarcina sp. resist]|uniref:GNAT family N-acetyltransferase n=1 Tax=Sporosarcina TaxID=1569 RepID=UPI00078EC258|nr:MULTISPECIES: GNAT family N-acetyltransferase [Sporosarcina]AMQ05953.1 spermidine acetyltransferase [Sporosarcina psychrophila]QNK90533.1 GNAT family N-acetyltransferase [Sporosarcina sp. resist]
MTVIINEVTKDNINDILKLRINEEQQSFIETPQQCLDEAKVCSNFQPVGLYWEKNLVGFAMYGFFPDEGINGRVWLDRFLIDSKYQGLGLGSIMLSALIQRLEQEYSCNEIYLSIIADNQGALHLYQKFGFKFNGEVDSNNEKLMVKSL